MLGYSIINVEKPKYKPSLSDMMELSQRVIDSPVSVSEPQDVTEETPQAQSYVQPVPQAQSYVQTVPKTQSYVQPVPQAQSYVQYVPVYHKPDYKKIILVGGGIILFAVLLKKVIR